jgi:hypothetical protein
VGRKITLKQIFAAKMDWPLMWQLFNCNFSFEISVALRKGSF